MSSGGKWEKNGRAVLLVDKSSAIQLKSDRIVAVDEDHSNMVKFGADDSNCRVIIDYINDAAKNVEQLTFKKATRGKSNWRSSYNDRDDDFEDELKCQWHNSN